MEYDFTVVTERDEDGRYLAICPALQGCYTEGETLEEAKELIQDAIRLHVEDRLADGEPIDDARWKPSSPSTTARSPRYTST